MNISHLTLAALRLRSLSWDGDALIDWIGGARYHLDGTREEVGGGYSYRFDAAVGMGSLGARFEALGTKGLLLRYGERAARGGTRSP